MTERPAPPEYESRALAFLSRNGIQFSVKLVGKDCPSFCADKDDPKLVGQQLSFPRKSHLHGYHYLATFRRSAKVLTIDFWNSFHDEEYNWLCEQHELSSIAVDKLFRSYGFRSIGSLWVRPKVVSSAGKFIPKPKQVPTAYDVLACVQKSNPGTFDSFCGDFGYDHDSRRVEASWRGCCDEWNRMSEFFATGELVELQEID